MLVIIFKQFIHCPFLCVGVAHCMPMWVQLSSLGFGFLGDGQNWSSIVLRKTDCDDHIYKLDVHSCKHYEI